MFKLEDISFLRSNKVLILRKRVQNCQAGFQLNFQNLLSDWLRSITNNNHASTWKPPSVMAWVAVISINCLCHVTFHSLIWPSRRVGNFGYTIWMIATMLGLLASCSLGNDLRCRYSIEMPSLLKRMNQTQLPSKYKHFCTLQRPDQGSLTLTRVVR